jgi:hypothetical protein
MPAYNDMPRADKAAGGLKSAKPKDAVPDKTSISAHLSALFSPAFVHP